MKIVFFLIHTFVSFNFSPGLPVAEAPLDILPEEPGFYHFFRGKLLLLDGVHIFTVENTFLSTPPSLSSRSDIVY